MKIRRGLMVVVTTLGLVAATAGAASAVSWDTDWARDFGGTAPSNRAYVKGAMRLAHDSDGWGNEDQRITWSARIHVQGPRGGCGRFKVETYVGNKLMNDGYHLEKRFPSSGYYTHCVADGRGTSSLYTGTDIQDRSIWDIGRFKRVRVTVCWTANRSTPVGGDCYSFKAMGR